MGDSARNATVSHARGIGRPCRAALAAIGLFVAACGEAPEAPAPGASAAERSTVDLPGMVERGTLRILLERDRESYLPRDGAALYAERELATRFARRVGLDAELVFVDRFADLIPALSDGRGDLVAANLTVTAARRDNVAFTRPLAYGRDTLAVAAPRAVPDSGDPLTGTIAAREDTTLLATARSLAAQHPQLDAIAVDGAVSNEDLVDRLVAGEFDYVLQDGNVLEVMLGYRDDIVAGPPVTDPRPLAWAVRPGNPELLAALDSFLTEFRLLGDRDASYVEDLPALKERRRLRMITRNNASTYFLWRGELLGFEYELARRFAESEDLRLEVVVAPSHDAMLPMLLEGRGDFAAAYLVPTAARTSMGASFTRPYHYASEVIVGRAGEADVASAAALAGRTIAMRRSSSYWSHVQRLVDGDELDVELRAVPPDMETEQVIDGVAAGRFDLTVADSHILAIEMTWRDDVKGLLNLGDERPHAWAVHPDNTALKSAMDAFIARTYRGLFYNVRYNMYFGDPRYVADEPAGLVAPGAVSPWDDLVRDYASRYGFDWRLLVAQMHQESRFDPAAESWMGAKGLMQVLPRTAAEFGFDDLGDPATGIHAGVRYLAWVRERFPERLPPGVRTWLALAGYNAGHGHVRDARRLAQELGYDPDRWFGHVELAMLKLAEEEYASRARHGYVRGTEPVQYVRSIRRRFQAYSRLLAR